MKGTNLLQSYLLAVNNCCKRITITVYYMSNTRCTVLNYIKTLTDQFRCKYQERIWDAQKPPPF